MPLHKNFMAEFQKNLPEFIQNKHQELYDDITFIMQQGLQNKGVEFRGYFSIEANKNTQRNTFKFKDLHTKKQ